MLRTPVPTRLAVAAALVTAGLLPATATAARAAPPETGCPASYQLLSLDDLEQQGYIFRPELDANQDRHICGKPLNERSQEKFCLDVFGGDCPVPIIYAVRDNDVTKH